MLRNVSQLVPSNSGAWHTKKLKNRLKGVSISRNVSLIFSKKWLIFIPNPGGQLRPKYPLDNPCTDFTDGILVKQLQSVFRELIKAGADIKQSSGKSESAEELYLIFKLDKYQLW